MATFAVDGHTPSWNHRNHGYTGGMFRDDVNGSWMTPLNAEDECKLACSTYSDCQSYGLNSAKTSCVLFKAPLDYYTTWGSVGANKTAGPPNPVYTTKPLKHETTLLKGGADWVSFLSGGNCAGFNNYGGFPGRDVAFGANYNGRCPTRFLLNYCPRIGNLVSGHYSNPDGSSCDSAGAGCAGGDLDNNLRVTCGYNTIDMTNFISAGQFNDQLLQQYFDDNTWTELKDNYCAIGTNVDKSECVSWFGTFGQANGSNKSYNSAKLPTCTNTMTTASCRTSINDTLRTGLPADQLTAASMVQTYCDAHPTASECGCYNVVKYGMACINDASKRSYPGCDNIYEDYALYPAVAQGLAGADKFCGSGDCLTSAASGNTQFLPAARSPSATCPPLQVCIQDFRNASFINSDLTAQCKQTLNIGGSSSTSTTRPSTSATKSSTSASKSSSSSTTTKSSSLFIICGIFASILFIFAVILLLMTSGDD